MLRHPTTLEGDAFAPCVCTMFFKTIVNNGFKFRFVRAWVPLLPSVRPSRGSKHHGRSRVCCVGENCCNGLPPVDSVVALFFVVSRYALLVFAKNWRDSFAAPASDWMKRYLEVEAAHLQVQVRALCVCVCVRVCVGAPSADQANIAVLSPLGLRWLCVACASFAHPFGHSLVA